MIRECMLEEGSSPTYKSDIEALEKAWKKYDDAVDKARDQISDDWADALHDDESYHDGRIVRSFVKQEITQGMIVSHVTKSILPKVKKGK